jgi:hypothetical protein
MVMLLHELHGRGVVRLEQARGRHLVHYMMIVLSNVGTDLHSLRSIFGFHVLEVLDNEAWYAACL